MRLLTLRQIVVCIFAVVAQFASGCDGYTHIGGTVVDSSKVPVANAEVVLFQPDEGEKALRMRVQSTSDIDGTFVVGGSHAPMDLELQLEVSKPGFATHVERVRSGTNVNSGTIVLLPAE